MIDAKNFLDHDDGRLGPAGGIGAIGAQFKSVRSRQCDVLSHGSSISCWGLHEVIGSEKRGKALIFGAWSFRKPVPTPHPDHALLPHPVVAPVAFPAGQPAFAELQVEPVLAVKESAAADIAEREKDFVARAAADVIKRH